MVALSVNVNKVATLRNSRGGDTPCVLAAVEVCLHAGVKGITVHPRHDERHITARDVLQIASRLKDSDARGVEFNIEGDPRPEWLALVNEVRPTQATLVPVRAGEITSEAGWPQDTRRATLREHVTSLRDAGIRVSVFVDPTPHAIELAHEVDANRVELYTGPFALAHAKSVSDGRRAFDDYRAAAELAHQGGLGVNAGHDLDLTNLQTFLELPHLDEVSIGHALMSHALFVGLERSVRDYLAVVEKGAASDRP